jgi:YHS domain-containing protein
MSLRTILLVVLAGAIVLSAGMLGGCKKEEPAPAKPAVPAAPAEPNKVAAAMEQTTCPVMGGAVDKSVFVEYKGKKVYFCCPECKAEFEKEPEKYVAKLPQFK